MSKFATQSLGARGGNFKIRLSCLWNFLKVVSLPVDVKVCQRLQNHYLKLEDSPLVLSEAKCENLHHKFKELLRVVTGSYTDTQNHLATLCQFQGV